MATLAETIKECHARELLPIMDELDHRRQEFAQSKVIGKRWCAFSANAQSCIVIPKEVKVSFQCLQSDSVIIWVTRMHQGGPSFIASGLTSETYLASLAPHCQGISNNSVNIHNLVC